MAWLTSKTNMWVASGRFLTGVRRAWHRRLCGTRSMRRSLQALSDMQPPTYLTSCKSLVTLAKAVFSAERLLFDFSSVALSSKHGMHYTEIHSLCKDATVATIARLAHHVSTPL